jgi:hypothetical protein
MGEEAPSYAYIFLGAALAIVRGMLSVARQDLRHRVTREPRSAGSRKA